MLVNYGYYDNLEDIKNVVHPLIAMLDGRTDVPHASEHRHKIVLSSLCKSCCSIL